MHESKLKLLFSLVDPESRVLLCKSKHKKNTKLENLIVKTNIALLLVKEQNSFH